MPLSERAMVRAIQFGALRAREKCDGRDHAALTVSIREMEAYLATVDAGGHPRLRPVSPVRTDGFVVYVANLRSYRKTAEIAASRSTEACISGASACSSPT